MSGHSSPADPPQMILNEERKQFVAAMIQPGMASLGPVTDPRQDEELFLTPISSPAYSSDGSNYGNELPVDYYTATSGLQGFGQPMTALPPISAPQQPYMSGPGSPCDEYYSSSPYSSPYTNSPAPSHSPASSCIGSQYDFVSVPQDTKYSSSPCFTTSCATLPQFSHDIKPVSTCSSMPPSGYYPTLAQPIQTWGNHLNPFQETFMMENTLAFHPDEGEVPIEMIEQGINTGGIDYYPLTPESPENRQSYYTPPVCSPYHATKGNNKDRRRSGQKKPPKPPVQVDDSDIKDIPTSAQLWEFTLRVIKKPKYQYMVSWENKKEGLFRFRDAQAFAAVFALVQCVLGCEPQQCRLLFHYIRLGFHMLCRDTNTGHRSLFKINWRCSDFLFSSVQCFLEKGCKQFIANSCSSKKLKHKKWLPFRESRSPVIDTQPQRRAQKSLKSDWSTSHTPRYQD